MIDTSIQRVEINQVIENQLPEFVQAESPLFVDFMKQYYISQENQILQFPQLLQFSHQQHLQLQLEPQLVELTELQPLHQPHQLIHLPHPHQAVDLAIAADINDRHINTKS